MNINLELSYHQMKEEQNLIDFEQFQKRNSLKKQPKDSRYFLAALILALFIVALAGFGGGSIIAIFQK